MKKFICVILVFFNLFSKIPGKVTICSIGKNVENAIPNSIKTIEGIGNLFEDYRVFIYENNSSDNTPKLLKNWSQKNTKVKVISEVLSYESLIKKSLALCWDRAPFRVCILAMARNIVLKLAMNKQFDDYEYFIMTEMDFHLPWDYKSIEDIFSKYNNLEWDAIFANGVMVTDNELTYDTYTYRDYNYPFGPELLGEEWWFNTPKIRLPKHSMVPVISAFGGLGIYKRKAIKDCFYSGVVNYEMNEFMESFFKNNIKHVNSVVRDKYFEDLKKLKSIYSLNNFPKKQYKNDPDFFSYNVGLKFNSKSKVVWKFQSGIKNYPVVCDHHPFHAAMANRGHDKLFVYSELKPIYG